MIAADCIITWASVDVICEAYALGKGCCASSSDPRVAFGAAGELVDFGFLEQNVQDQVQQTLQRGSNNIVQDPALVEKYYYKLDGLWWQRALNLAHKLTGAV